MTEMPTTMTSTTPSESYSLDSLSKRDQKRIVAWVNEEFTKCKTNRWKAERQWYLNLAFYFGKQNILAQDAPGTSRQFRLWTPPAPYYKSRPIINQIKPRARKEMSKLTAQKPSAFVVPASSDDRDMYAAHAGEQIWDSIYRDKKLHSILRRAAFWDTITGNGFIKCYWDEDKVDSFSDQMGDMCFEVITPLHLLVPDLKEPDIELQPYVIHAATKSLEQVNMLYKTNVSANKARADLLEESFINVMGVEQSTGAKDDNVLVLEMWVKPGFYNRMPEGGLITIAGDTVLNYVEGWPYLHGEYPFAHMRNIETGKFYGDSMLTDLIPLQREYNRTRGQIIEAKNKMAKPQLAAEIGSIDASKITSEPGQIIFYRPGFQAPQPIPLQPLPSYVLEEQDRIRMDMDEISAQHEVSRGQVPSGVTAATAISYLQEQDESSLAYAYDSIEEALEKLARHALVYVKQFWDTPRMVKVTGEDGSFDVMAFQGSDLRDNTDIRVEAGSALPTSRAAKQAFIMDLMKMGFIDPNKGLEVMEIGGINKIYEQIQVDVRQAQRENLKMAQATPELLEQHYQEALQQFMTSPEGQNKMQQGLLMQGPDGSFLDLTDMAMGVGGPKPLELPLIVPVNSWDDHRIHMERHNNYRKSQAFENLTPEAKALFEQHVQAHVRAIMVGAEGAMQMPPGMLEMAANPETVKELSQGSTDQALPGMEQM